MCVRVGGVCGGGGECVGVGECVWVCGMKVNKGCTHGPIALSISRL